MCCVLCVVPCGDSVYLFNIVVGSTLPEFLLPLIKMFFLVVFFKQKNCSEFNAGCSLVGLCCQWFLAVAPCSVSANPCVAIFTHWLPSCAQSILFKQFQELTIADCNPSGVLSTSCRFTRSVGPRCDLTLSGQRARVLQLLWLSGLFSWLRVHTQLLL